MYSLTNIRVALLGVGSIAIAGCAARPGVSGGLKAAGTGPAKPNVVAPILGQRPAHPVSLPFHIAWSSTGQPEQGWMKWDATYTAHGRTARFRIELTAGPAEKDGPFVMGRGFFCRLPGSDPAGLLTDLKPVLEAKHLPGPAKWLDRLAFDVAILGMNLSKAPDTAESAGGFRSEPPGRWMPTKVFLPNGVEFFLNINSTTGEAEFSLKDEEYGDEILKLFATVL